MTLTSPASLGASCRGC